jgi:hypothetical protein
MIKRSCLQAFAILLIVISLCSGSGLKRAGQANQLRVLFIGNSLTYFNDLPSFVQAFAHSAKQKPLAFKAVTFANFSLEDHWNQGDSRKAIAQGNWDVVVLQQGPSASTDGRKSLLEYSRRFANEIHRVKAKPALYMVWPSASRMQDFNGVIESYRRAAEEIEGLLFPVGEAWLRAWKRDPKLELYSTDGLHPTVAGTYLAAAVIYEQLYGETPVGLPSKFKLSSGANIEVPTQRARLMQEAAAEVKKRGVSQSKAD